MSAGNEDEVEDKLWAEVLQMIDQSEATRAIKMTWRLERSVCPEKDVMREVIDALSRRFFLCVQGCHACARVCRAHGGINAVQVRHVGRAHSMHACMHACMPVHTDVCMHVYRVRMYQ